MPKKKGKGKKGKNKSKNKKSNQGFRSGVVSVKSLKKVYPTLKKLSKTKNPTKITSILNRVPNSGIKAICECTFNAIYSNKISKRNLARLKKLSPTTKLSLREITALPVNSKFKQKKALLSQAGGGLGTIIASVLPLLLSLFKKS